MDSIIDSARSGRVHPAPISERISTIASRTIQLSPNFRTLQIGGWIALCILTFPLKVTAYGSASTAILITLFREPLGLLMTSGFRLLFLKLRLRSSKPIRLLAWVVPLSFAAGTVDLLISLELEKIHPRFIVAQNADGFLYFRSLLYCAWCSLYFWIRDSRSARRRINALARAEAAAREAEILKLRAQVSPHFLFNAFNTILADLESRPSTVPNLVQGLADYFRYSLGNRDSHFVPIGEEFDAMENFLLVEKARFRESVEITTFIDPAIRGTAVPGVFLQPLVENALRYGHRTSPCPLKIRLAIQPSSSGGLLVQVRNSGRWIEPPEHREPGDIGGNGLSTLRRRLKLLYPDTHTLHAGETPDGSAVLVRIELPATPSPIHP